MLPKSSWVVLLALAATSLSFAATQTIELKNGTKIIGTIDKQDAGKVFINAELIGPIVVNISDLASAEGLSPAIAATPPSHVAQPAPVVAMQAASTPTARSKADAERPFWKRTLSFNGSYNTASYVQGPIPGAPPGAPTGSAVGLQGKQSTAIVNAGILRATPIEAITLSGSYAYANYEPAGVVLDNWSGEFTYTRMLSPRNYVLARSSYRVDDITLVDHSFEQVVGYGFKLVETERTTLDLIPGLSEVHERKGSEFDDEWILSAGFLERFEHAFSKTFSVEQRFKYRVGVNESEVWAINAYLGLNSALTKHLTLTIGATYTYDNTLGPLPLTIANSFIAQGFPPAIVAQLRPAKKEQLQITSGVEFSW